MTIEKPNEANEEKSVISIGGNPFFAPSGGVLGDTFPFFHNGACHLFVLQPPHVAHFVSTNLINWETRPVAIPSGPPDAPDTGMIATGVVVKKDDLFYMFYTAGPAQTICLATSTDLDYWTKDARNPILVPDGKRYVQGYFRDPYVFYNEDEKCWWMLLGSRVPGRPGPRAGCVGLAKSPDLLDWTLSDPLWAPGIGPHTDCPQLIQQGNQWYLFYLQRNTRYRVADKPAGPFERPSIRDMGVMYAAAASRPVFEGHRWITFPFVPDLQDEKDLGDWKYGGPVIVPRELHFTPDGDVVDRPLTEIVDTMRLLPTWVPGSAQLRPLLGEWNTEASGQWVCESTFGGTLLVSDVPGNLFLEAEVILQTDRMEAHIILRAREDLEAGYKLALHPGEARVDVRRISDIDIDRVMISRPISLPIGKPIKVQIFLFGSVLDAFIDDVASITTRVYEIRQGALILEFRDSAGAFRNVNIRQLHQNEIRAS